MASSYGKKKTLREKFNAVVAKVLVTTGLLAVPAVPAYYEYGTVKEQDVVVNSQQSNAEWKDGQTVGSYIFYTDKGTFIAAPSRPHFQSQEDANAIYGKIYNGRTYHIKTYGVHAFSSWQPNILSADPVTDEQLAARKAAEDKAREKMAKPKAPAAAKAPGAASADPRQPQTAQPAGTVQQGVLSGEVVTVDLYTEDRTRVRLTIPVETKDQILIQSVTPPRVIRPPTP